MPSEPQAGKMSRCITRSSTHSQTTYLNISAPIVHQTTSATGSTSARLASNMFHQQAAEEASMGQRRPRVTVPVRSPTILLCLLGLCLLAGSARAAHMVLDPTSTTPAGSSLEDPSNSEFSATSLKDESMCDRCYEYVEKSQRLIDIHQQSVEREKKLLRQKQTAAKASKQVLAQAASSTTTTTSTTRRPRLNHMGQPLGRDRHRTSQSSLHGQMADIGEPDARLGSAGAGIDSGPSYGHPTVRNVEGTPIIVSRLRVARSSPSSHFGYSNSSRPKANKGSREEMDAQIAQLKLQQKQVFNETCGAIHSVQKCVEEYERECLGNLQYHSFDSFASQWMSKLNCPSYRYPNIKPWPALTRSIQRPRESERTIVPRPITSEEAIKKRLDDLLGQGGYRPLLGVELKPTLSLPGTAKFNSIDMFGQQQLEGSADLRGFKGYERMSARSDNPSVYRGAVQSGNQTVPLAGHLLLIPCCLFVMIIVLVLVLARSHSSYLKPT